MTDPRLNAITVNVLTGFLGAGKTTLLNQLLKQEDLADSAVIINEFGSIGVDHLLVETIDEETVLLQSGCICCTIRTDLKAAILALFEKRKAGRIAPFRRLLIETTGLADPAPIIATLTTDLMLKYHFRMGNIVVVVDAPNGASNIDAYPESARQIAVADRIVLTKTDIADPQTVSALVRHLSAINPTAPIALAHHGSMDDSVLTQDIHDLGQRPAEVRRWIRAERYHAHDHPPPADETRHGSIRATSIAVEHPVSWPKFAVWLSLLIHRHGADILRVKGVLPIEGQVTPVVIHGVQHLIHKPLHLDCWPPGMHGGVLVFISSKDLGDIERSFSAFVGCASSAAAFGGQAARA